MYVQSKCRLPTSPKVSGHHTGTDPFGRGKIEAFGYQDPEGNGIQNARLRKIALGSTKGEFF